MDPLSRVLSSFRPRALVVVAILWGVLCVLPCAGASVARAEGTAHIANLVGVDAAKYLSSAPERLVRYAWLSGAFGPLFALYLARHASRSGGSITRRVAHTALVQFALVALGAGLLSLRVAGGGADNWVLAIGGLAALSALPWVGIASIISRARSRRRFLILAVSSVVLLGTWGTLERRGHFFWGSPGGIENRLMSGRSEWLFSAGALVVVWLLAAPLASIAASYRRVRDTTTAEGGGTGSGQSAQP